MPFLADKMKKLAVLITILTQVPVILGQLKIPKHRKKQ